MAAIDIYNAQPDFVRGRETRASWRNVHGDPTTIGASESFNINAGAYVNHAFWTLHHKRSEIPTAVEAIGDWATTGASRETFGSEQCCSFIYGDWANRCYRAFGVFAQANDAVEVALSVGRHIQIGTTLYALATGWRGRNTGYGPGLRPCLVTGLRSFVVRDHKQLGYTDSQGRYNPPYNLDSSSLDLIVAMELGLASSTKGYGKLTDALDDRFPIHNWKVLPVPTIERLRRLIEGGPYLYPGLGDDLLACKDDLERGPYFKFPMEIVKTTEGVAYILAEKRGSTSTSELMGKVWYQDPALASGTFKSVNWWNTDPRFGWLSVSPPKRKAGAGLARAWIAREGGSWRAQAQDGDGRYFDVAKKKDLPGVADFRLPGDLVYRIRIDGAVVEVESPAIRTGGGGTGGGGGGSLLERIIAFLRRLFT